MAFGGTANRVSKNNGIIGCGGWVRQLKIWAGCPKKRGIREEYSMGSGLEREGTLQGVGSGVRKIFGVGEDFKSFAVE